MKSVVAKYGGTSVANIKQLLMVVKTNPHQKVIVVSAPGKLHSADTKVTDLLIKYTDQKDQKILNQIVTKFREIGANDEIIQELTSKLLTITDNHQITSLGEHYAARIVAGHTGYKFIDAAQIFRFDKNGNLDFSETTKLVHENISPTKFQYVIPGFYGSDGNGKIRLFGRGGSDRSGALLASILDFDYENWTDVNGIYSADPRVMGEDCIIIPEITIAEIREGANGGTEVLMGDTIFDLHKSNVTTTVKNTFDPKKAGTRVRQTRKSLPDNPVVSVAGHDDLVKLEIRRFGLNKIPGYIHRLLAHFSSDAMPEPDKISIEYLPTGIDALSVTVRTSQLTQQQLVRLESLPELIAKDTDLAPDNRMKWSKIAVVYLVGQDLLDKQVRTKAHNRATGALLRHSLYFEDDVSDACSPSIAFLVDRKSMKPAIRAIHQEFFRN